MARRNVTIRQGATWIFAFRVRDDGAVQDLAGWQARMQVRETHASATTLLSLTSSPAAGITIDASLGKVTIEASATATAALPAPLAAVYDIEIVSPAGKVDRVLEGVARITPEVTR